MIARLGRLLNLRSDLGLISLKRSDFLVDVSVALSKLLFAVLDYLCNSKPWSTCKHEPRAILPATMIMRVLREIRNPRADCLSEHSLLQDADFLFTRHVSPFDSHTHEQAVKRDTTNLTDNSPMHDRSTLTPRGCIECEVANADLPAGG